jgi:hypothetical protein
VASCYVLAIIKLLCLTIAEPGYAPIQKENMLHVVTIHVYQVSNLISLSAACKASTAQINSTNCSWTLSLRVLRVASSKRYDDVYLVFPFVSLLKHYICIKSVLVIPWYVFLDAQVNWWC